jgi:hypothetical protein
MTTYTFSPINGEPRGINDLGQIVGIDVGADRYSIGFIYNNGVYTTIGYPSATNGTFFNDINNSGVIVGYASGPYLYSYRFLYSAGTFTLLPDNPLAPVGASAWGFRSRRFGVDILSLD